MTDAAPPDNPRRWIESQRSWPLIAASGVLEDLAAFDPVVAGSWPIGLARPHADVDVICHARALDLLARRCRQAFGDRPDFSEERAPLDPPAYLCRFAFRTLRFEVFGQDLPVDRQNAYRHMVVERRVLDLAGPSLKEAVMDAKASGLTTEEAFARVLGLDGDPYLAVLLLESLDDAALRRLLQGRRRNLASE